LLQPLADGLKFLFKEDLLPPSTDRFIYLLAPFLALSLALTTIALIPFGPATIHILGQPTGLVVANVDISLLFIFAITSIGVYGVALAGWSSNSKYPLLGGLRSAAQMVSYEVSLTLSVVGVLLLANSLSLSEIIQGQHGYWYKIIPRWHFIPQIVGLICYFSAAIAETNRAPFDLPEAESELVAGFHTEYSSFKFAMFFMAEYANMVTVSCLATILFFGGWLSPFPDSWTWTHYLPTVVFGAGGILLLQDGMRHHRGFGRVAMLVVSVMMILLAMACGQPGLIDIVQGPFWFLLKVFILLFVYVWVRGTLPRFRYDQLMNFGWKFLLPLSLANLLMTSLVILVLHR
jgi:NADH-quinone oxidoreductase subunit H